MKNIKKIIFFSFLFSIFISILFIFPTSARENVSDWYIKDFQTEIIVTTDSGLTITERIVADCGEANNKHGIFRVFPKIQKTKDGNFITPIELISITDENGQRLKYQQQQGANTVTYKIGDPKVEVKGENVYIIKYKLKGVIRNLNEQEDELYFDVLGSFWDLEIDNFTANIVFPDGITETNSDVYLYSGSLDSSGNTLAEYKWLSENNLEINSNKMIAKREGITVSVAFPTNILTLYQPTVAEKSATAVSSYLPLNVTPTNIWRQFSVTLLLILLAFFIWYKYGRDPISRRPIIAEFEAPDKMTPLEMSVLLKESGKHNNAITASIINLAVKGYLKIEKIEKSGLFSSADYKLIRSEKKDDGLYRYEKDILQALFKGSSDVKLSRLKNKFARRIQGLSGNVASDLKERGLIDKKSTWRQIAMIGVGVLLLFIFAGEPVMLASFAFIAFGIFMRRLTPQGSEIKRQVEGFKLYLKTAEKYRARFYEKENMMEALLPYAILFNLTKEWIRKMKDIYGEDYLKNHNLTFMAGAVALSDFNAFETAISDVSRSISSHVSSSSSGSSGGGSVGGGGGGGGGGGW
jgi:uncharacterized membrane protein